MFRTILKYCFWTALIIAFGIALSSFLMKGGALAYSYITGAAPQWTSEDNSRPVFKQISSSLANKSQKVRESIAERNIKQLNVSIIQSVFEQTTIQDTPKSSVTGEADEIRNMAPVSLMFVGDIMLDRGVENSVNKNFDGDFGALFANLEILQEADILFGNLEGPASDKGKNVGSKWSFRMNPAALPALKEAGFDIVSFANNHVGDWGQGAFLDTLFRLKENQILFAGAGLTKLDAETPQIISKNGLKVGFLAFSDVGPRWMEAGDKAGILLTNDPRLEEIIQNASEEVDVLVVSFHFGDEYKEHNSRQETLARKAIDSGAKIVIGHHPHVIQDTEFYKKGFIAYSLGNFIFDQYFSEETMQGLLLEIKLAKNPFSQRVEISETNKKIIKLNRFYQPDEIIPLTENKDTPEIPSTLSASHDYYHKYIKPNNPSRDISSIDNYFVKQNTSTSPCPEPTKDFPDLSLFNVSTENSVGDYVPENLIPIKNMVDTQGKDICLGEEAALQLEDMFNDAKKLGIHLTVFSGFRSPERQNTLFKNWIARNLTTGAALAVASPEHSEHQLGTAVDLTGSSVGYEPTKVSFDQSSEYKWLEENAYKYGFALSYPKGKEYITGYIYEPWHWRYIGVENATQIEETGLTITEFLGNMNVGG